MLGPSVASKKALRTRRESSTPVGIRNSQLELDVLVEGFPHRISEANEASQ